MKIIFASERETMVQTKLVVIIILFPLDVHLDYFFFLKNLIGIYVNKFM